MLTAVRLLRTVKIHWAVGVLRPLRRQLTAMHLKTHDLTARAYWQKWGLSLEQPLCAIALTKVRRKAAKKRGLIEKLVTYIEERRRKKAQITFPETVPLIPTPTEKEEVKAVVKRR
jgi:predicted transcriptional regulator